MNSLARFVAQRLALLVLTLFAVSVLIFTITQLLPGDVATMILGMQATPQDLATLRTQLGLDQPALVQFWRWLGGDPFIQIGRDAVVNLHAAEDVTHYGRRLCRVRLRDRVETVITASRTGAARLATVLKTRSRQSSNPPTRQGRI